MTHTYSGGTTVSAGTLLLDNSTIANSAVTVTNASIGTTAATPTGGGDTIGKTLTVGGNSFLADGSNLSVSGQTTVTDGTFSIGASSYIATTTLTAVGGLTVNNGATIAAVGVGNSIISLGAPGLTYNSYLSSQFQGTLEGAGGLLVNGQPYLRKYATLELENPDNTYQGGTTVEGGLLQLDYGGALPAGGMLADNVTPAGEMLQINGPTSGVVLSSTLMPDVSGLGYGGSTGGPAAPAGVAAPAGMSPVPEPGTLLLLAAGAVLAGLAAWRRRKRGA